MLVGLYGFNTDGVVRFMPGPSTFLRSAKDFFAVLNRIHIFAVFDGFCPRFAWGEEPFLRFTHGKVLRFGGAVLQFCTGKLRVSRLKAAIKRGEWSG